MLLRVQAAGRTLAAFFMRLTRGGHSSDGQGLAEYALILALLAIVAIIALLFLGGQVSKILSTVGKSI
ncbi:MAG: Flp family type IVb pilin [Chloroflexota bacterium]